MHLHILLLNKLMKPIDRKNSQRTYDHTTLYRQKNSLNSANDLLSDNNLESEAEISEKPHRASKIKQMASLQMGAKKSSFLSQIPTSLKQMRSIQEARELKDDTASMSSFKSRHDAERMVRRQHREIHMHKACQKSTQFFSGKTVGTERAKLEVVDNAGETTDLDLRCSGQGYFEKHQKELQSNFLEYLRLCVNNFGNLYTVRVDFGGFDVGNSILQEVLMVLRGVEHVRSASIQTSALVNAEMSDLAAMLDIMSAFGQDPNCEEFSMQVAGWKFREGLDFRRMNESFQDFMMECLDGLKFASFRLEMSGLNVTEREAEEFLKTTTHRVEELTDAVLRKRTGNDGRAVFRLIERLGEGETKRCQELVRKFVFESMEMSLEQMKGHPANEEFRALTGGYSLTEQLLRARVDIFHNAMVELIEALQRMMPNLEEFTVDLRGWNELLRMGELKKRLQSEIAVVKNEYSMVKSKRVEGGTVGTPSPPRKEEKTVKIIYMV